jgi:hypothetical protein
MQDKSDDISRQYHLNIPKLGRPNYFRPFLFYGVA